MSTSRPLLLLIAVLCSSAVALALISQHIFDMQPCAWCVMQRLIYLVIAAVCLLGCWDGRVLRRVSAVLAAALAAAGVMAAYYQYTVASHTFSCEQTFADRLMAGSGLDAAMPQVFGIYASCMDAVVTVLGVDYALWSLGLFAVLAVLALAALFERARA